MDSGIKETAKIQLKRIFPVNNYWEFPPGFTIPFPILKLTGT
jgi:hypothetical protein